MSSKSSKRKRSPTRRSKTARRRARSPLCRIQNRAMIVRNGSEVRRRRSYRASQDRDEITFRAYKPDPSVGESIEVLRRKFAEVSSPLTVKKFVEVTVPVLRQYILEWDEKASLMHDENNIRNRYMDVLRYNNMTEVPAEVNTKIEKLQPFYKKLVECYLTGDGSSITQDFLNTYPNEVKIWKDKMVTFHAKMPTLNVQDFQATAAAQMLYEKGVEQKDFFAPVCPEERVYSSLENLLNYYNKNEKTADTARMATLLEILIKWIHPFHDGNGRTARAFALTYLDRKNRPITRITSGVERSIDNVLERYETALNNGLTEELCHTILTKFEEKDLYYNNGFITTHWSP